MEPTPANAAADAVDASTQVTHTQAADDDDVDPVETLKRTLDENASRQHSAEFDRLLAPIEKHLRRRIRKRNCFLLLQATLCLAVAASGLLYYGPVYAHLRAFGRLGLIKLAPYWSWTDYYDQECLVENSLIAKPYRGTQHPPSCAGCEDVVTIQALTNVSLKHLVENYVKQHLPVIVSDGALDWPLTNDHSFDVQKMSKKYRDDDSVYGICEWSSNLGSENIDLDEFFSFVNRLPNEKSWFAHWENCGKRSVKTGRRFFSRPYFVTPAVDMSYNNWILLSKNYAARRFKSLKLRSRLAMFAQTHGANQIMLQPSEQCSAQCPIMQFTVLKGEILLFNPRKWQIQYKPMEGTANIAFIIQADLD